MAIAGLVLGIISFCCCWIPFFGSILSFLGLIFSGIGIGDSNRRGKAITGLVFSLIAFLVSLIWIFVFIEAADGELQREFERIISI